MNVFTSRFPDICELHPTHPNPDLWAPGGFELEDSDDFLGVARALLDGTHLGLLTTVDRFLTPRVRWMATVDFHEFPRFHALTSPRSRKLDELALNPRVNWLFGSQDLSLMVNLIGEAVELVDPEVIRTVWTRIKDTSHAYFLNESPGFSVLETTVHQIECTLPKNNLRVTLPLDDFAASIRRSQAYRAGAGLPASKV